MSTQSAWELRVARIKLGMWRVIQATTRTKKTTRYCKHCDFEHETYGCSKCGSFLSCRTSTYDTHHTDMDNVRSAHQHIICRKCGRDNIWYMLDGDIMWRLR